MKRKVNENDFTMTCKGEKVNFIDLIGMNVKSMHVYGRDDDVITERNIKLGDSKESVLKEYGDTNEEPFNASSDKLLELNKEKDGSICPGLATLEDGDVFLDYQYHHHNKTNFDEMVYTLRFYFGIDNKVKVIGIFTDYSLDAIIRTSHLNSFNVVL